MHTMYNLWDQNQINWSQFVSYGKMTRGEAMDGWQGDRRHFCMFMKARCEETERWRTEAKQVNRLWKQWILLPLGHLSFMSWTSFNTHALLTWTTTVPVQRSLFRAKCNAMQISQPCAVHCHSCFINCHEVFCVFYLQGHSGYINIYILHIIINTSFFLNQIMELFVHFIL